MVEYVFEILKGLFVNFGITFLAAIIPLGMGIPLSLLAKKSEGVGKIFGWIKIPFEIICVPFLVLLFYYAPGLVFGKFLFGSREVSSIVCVVLALTIAYMMYIPSRYNNSYSFLKNTFLNGLGLISALFKWSFFGGILICVVDAYRAASIAFGHTYKAWPYILLFLIVTSILLVLEVAKAVIKQFMK